MQTLKLTKKYEKYPEYKDSGVEWLGMIPKDWSVSKAKSFISEIESGVWGEDPKNDNDDIKCLRVADFDFERLTFKDVETVRNNPSLKHKKILRNGDILLEKSGGGEKTPVGRAVIFNSDEKMVCANFIDIVRVKSEVNSKFFAYQLYASYNSKLNIKSIKQNTGIQNLDIRSYFSEPYPVPAINIQLEIIKYLDEKIALIDQIIEKKEKQIELIREKKTAVIDSVITKGINGVSSNNWQNIKLKFIGKAIIGLTYSPEEITDGTGMLVLRSSNVQNDLIYLEDNVYVNKEIPLELITKKGDILICSRNGSRSLIGKNAVIDETSEGLTFGAFMTVFRTKNNEFVSYFLKSNIFMSQLTSTLTSTINQLTTYFLNNITISLPAKEEQAEIAGYLKEKLKNYDSAIKEVQVSIELMKEFKTSLISNVVTGKIKV